MAAFHTLRLPPIFVSPISGQCWRLRLRAGATRALDHHFFHISRGAVRSVSGNAMNGEEDEVSSSGNGSFAGKRSLVVVSFYKFAKLPDYEQKRAPLKELCERNEVILAPEGINGSPLWNARGSGGSDVCHSE